MDQTTRQALLALYDTPETARPGHTVPGYDRDHADRTSQIVQFVAHEIDLGKGREDAFETTTLLHDIGRFGIDPHLFGRIFGLGRELGLPLRPNELQERYPEISAGQTTSFFLELIGPELRRRGIPIDEHLVDHVRMRMDFKGRLRGVLEDKRTFLKDLGVSILPWMEKIMLYYYYPEQLAGESAEVRHMAMVLVACENFEAFNNRRRGRDYYGRRRERLQDVFAILDGFMNRRIVSPEVMRALRIVTASGRLDSIIKESRELPRDASLPEDDVQFIEDLKATTEA